METQDFNFNMTDEMREVGKKLSLKELLSLAMVESGFESARTGRKFSLKCVVDMSNGESYHFSLESGAKKIEK